VLSFGLLPGLVLSHYLLVLENPDLGVPTPRPPAEERGAAPQTPLHKVLLVGSVERFALASQWESICRVSFNIFCRPA
jgi:hypothetical protein